MAHHLLFNRIACRYESMIGLTIHPYEAGPSVRAFVGRFCDRKDCPLHREMEFHGSLHAIATEEAKYINLFEY